MTDETTDTVVEEKPAKRYRLLTRAQMHGAVQEPGYVFTLEEGQLGPHRTVVASNHGAQITDHMNRSQDLIDQPLYEEFIEPEPKRAIFDEPRFDISRVKDKHAEPEGEIKDPLLLEKLPATEG